MTAFRLNIYQQLEFASCALLRAYEFLCFRVSFVRLFFTNFGAGLLCHIFVIYTHRHTHGRPVLISLW
jgi:hypothetical protein